MTSEKVTCSGHVLNAIINYKGQVERRCRQLLNLLNEEGAGVVRGSNGAFQGAYTYVSPNHFQLTTSPKCPMGYGSRSDICLNPFRTLAAHMSSGYKRGDVIYVPETVHMKYPLFPGQPLAEWATHDGYWIIGDTGGAIVGRGRFDFFSGSMDWRDPQNPLSRLGFGEKQTQYCRVSGERAIQVREMLGFPGLSPKIQTALLENQAPQSDANVRMASLQQLTQESLLAIPATQNAEELSPSSIDSYSEWLPQTL